MILNHKFTIKNTEKIGIVLILFSIFYFDNSMITINSFRAKTFSQYRNSVGLGFSK